VSIITPAYNAERFIEQTILSVMEQSLSDWEHLIVVDAKSSDRTLDIVKDWELKDRRIRCLQSANVFGAAQNRNFAVDQAKGEFLAFLDADDLWTSDKLKKQIDFMQSKPCDFSYTTFTRIPEDGQKTGKCILAPEKLNYEMLLKNNDIGCLTVMLKKNAFSQIRFAEKGWEDMSLWLSLLKQVPFAYGLQESLAWYRIVSGSRSNNKVFSAKLRWQTYRNVESLSLWQSVYLFSFYVFTGIKKHFRF
jgi:teichuronic acid biosynthesis glycosyltransferase TuaG